MFTLAWEEKICHTNLSSVSTLKWPESTCLSPSVNCISSWVNRLAQLAEQSNWRSKRLVYCLSLILQYAWCSFTTKYKITWSHRKTETSVPYVIQVWDHYSFWKGLSLDKAGDFFLLSNVLVESVYLVNGLVNESFQRRHKKRTQWMNGRERRVSVLLPNSHLRRHLYCHSLLRAVDGERLIRQNEGESRERISLSILSSNVHTKSASE